MFKDSMHNFEFWREPFWENLGFSSGFMLFFTQINQILRSEGMMSEYLYDCKVLTLPELGSDDCFMTPDSFLEPFVSLRTSSGSSVSYGGVDSLTIACTATTEVVRKKRTSKSAIPAAARKPVTPPAVEVTTNRRKGMPCRSPFNWWFRTVGYEWGGCQRMVEAHELNLKIRILQTGPLEWWVITLAPPSFVYYSYTPLSLFRLLY